MLPRFHLSPLAGAIRLLVPGRFCACTISREEISQKIMLNAIDRDGSWLYRAGGISALALGIAYIVIIALYVHIGAPPSGVEARLAYLAGNTTVWWAIL